MQMIEMKLSKSCEMLIFSTSIYFCSKWIYVNKSYQFTEFFDSFDYWISRNAQQTDKKECGIFWLFQKDLELKLYHVPWKIRYFKIWRDSSKFQRVVNFNNLIFDWIFFNYSWTWNFVGRFLKKYRNRKNGGFHTVTEHFQYSWNFRHKMKK